MAKNPMRRAEILNRLTGISTPIFGVSWTPATLDRDVAREVMLYLEDRRLLYGAFATETANYCVASAQEIRSYITEVLGRGGIADELVGHLMGIRAACREFVSKAEEYAAEGDPRWSDSYPRLLEWSFTAALGELRARLGIHVGFMAAQYDADIPDTLVALLPPAPSDEDAR